MLHSEVILAILMGVGLAAACGFRIFVPLLVVSIAAAGGHVELAPSFQWMGSPVAVVAFSIATVLEIAGYYIPWVDHLLDTLATPAAVVAGMIVSASVITDIDPMLKWVLVAIAGAGAAGAVQAVTVAARGLSTLTTGGFGNPVVATVEGGSSLLLAILAILLPLLAFVLVAVFLALAVRVVWRWCTRPRTHTPVSAA